MKTSARPSTITRFITVRDRVLPIIQCPLLLGIRLLFGWQFFLTGRGKLAHLDRTTEFFASLHIPAPGAHAVAIGSLELVGGLLLIVGLGTRAISALLAGTMIVAYLTAHRAEAFVDADAFMAAAPFPYLLATAVLFAFGPGRIALDALIVHRRACSNPAPST